jgi:transcriptional regulator with XRE-family HTH domain
MTSEAKFPVSCAAHFDLLRLPSPSARQAPTPGGDWGRADGSGHACWKGGPVKLGRSTCGFWPATTAASEWWVPPQLSLPGVHAIGADELDGLREVFPSLVDLLEGGRDVHPSGYPARGSSLVDGPTVHETDHRLSTGRNFGRHVRSLRRARGMTQEVLADRSALSADTIRRLEHGSFSPSLDTLRKLCVGLNLMLSTLFESFELGAPDEARELIDLLATRTPRELALATRVLRTLFDELDDMRGAGGRRFEDDEDDDEDLGEVIEGDEDEPPLPPETDEDL